MNVKLTDVERLTLLNQFKILSRITPEVDQDMVYSYYVDILENGFEYDYGRIFDDSMFSSVSKSNCEFVLNVMYMYRCIKQSYELLAINGAIDQILPIDVEFPGFDANEHGGYLRYCEHLVAEDVYPEYSGRQLKTHMPVLEKYTEMLNHFGAIDGQEQHRMSADQLKVVLGIKSINLNK